MARPKRLRKTCDFCGSGSFVQGCSKGFYCGKHRHQLVRHNRLFERTIRDKNEVVVSGDVVRVILRDRNQFVVGEALVDRISLKKISGIKWCLGQYGYAVTGQRTGSRLMHKMIYGKRGFEIDHMNGNRLDNRRANIRICTRSQNAKNHSKQKNNTSGALGVYFDASRKKYVAELKSDGVKKWLGRFTTLNEAKAARVAAEIKYFGRFRRDENE